MSLVERLEQQLRQRGLSIAGPRDGDADDQLRIVGPKAACTPELLEAVKKCKPLLLVKYGRKAVIEPDPTEGE